MSVHPCVCVGERCVPEGVTPELNGLGGFTISLYKQ